MVGARNLYSVSWFVLSPKCIKNKMFWIMSPDFQLPVFWDSHKDIRTNLNSCKIRLVKYYTSMINTPLPLPPKKIKLELHLSILTLYFCLWPFNLVAALYSHHMKVLNFLVVCYKYRLWM